MAALLRIAWRNASLNWRHSMMAIISVASGFVSLAVFQNYMVDVERLYVETYSHRFMYGHLIVEKRGAKDATGTDSSAYELNAADQAWISGYVGRSRARIRQSVRFLNVSGMISNGATSTIFAGYGYDLGEGAELRKPDWYWNTLAGRPLDATSPESGVVLGRSLASIMECEPESHARYLNSAGRYIPVERPFRCRLPDFQLTSATESGQANALNAVPVGIVDAAYKDIDTKFIAMPIRLAQELLGTENASYYALSLADGVDARAFARELKASAESQGIRLDVTRWQEHPSGDLYVRTMSLLTIFRDFVVAVILGIAGLSVLNTMVKIVTERTREIGALRSLGYSRSQVIALFLAESFFLSVIGVCIGALSSIALSSLINALSLPYKAGMLTEPVPFRVAFSPWIYASSAMLLSLIAVGAAALPTFHATSRKISELLADV